MEYVEGRSLREKLVVQKGALSIHLYRFTTSAGVSLVGKMILLR